MNKKVLATPRPQPKGVTPRFGLGFMVFDPRLPLVRAPVSTDGGHISPIQSIRKVLVRNSKP